MANYKVPQDVEADDKLIGPFSFRQFIYLLIVGAMIALAWALSQLFIGLAIIPIPVILLFGALALPLRKDQPMEIYLAAMISYYLKPRTRTWDPDGVESLIEITAPHVVEVQRAKDITQEDAQQRFGYLANLVDTQGWAVRGQLAAPNSPMTTASYYDAQSAEDVFDTNNAVAQTFNHMIEQEDAKHREQLLAKMHQQQPTPAVTPAPAPVQQQPVYQQFQPAQPVTQPATTPIIQTDTTPTPDFNPYPAFQQAVVQPLDNDAAHQLKMPPASAPITVSEDPKPAPQPPVEEPVLADIVTLAGNPDLSIETIAREAKRIHKKHDQQDSDGGFTISLH